MNRKNWLSLMLVVVIVLLGSKTARAQALSPVKLDEVAIQERVEQALRSRWDLLVNPTSPLEAFYHPAASALAASERARFEQHYLQPAREAGFKYTSVELDTEIRNIEVVRDTALVTVAIDVTYTSAYPDDPGPVITKECVEHTISVVWVAGNWYIIDDQYMDLYRKHGTELTDIPSLRNNVVSEASAEADSTGEPVPRWYHYYNRIGAVNYANTWWNSSNPSYRYFLGASVLCEGQD